LGLNPDERWKGRDTKVRGGEDREKKKRKAHYDRGIFAGLLHRVKR